MTAYSTIADSEIDPESPGTTTLFTKLRNNPIATTEGSSGAPKIQAAALEQTASSEAVITATIRDLAVTIVKLEASLAPWVKIAQVDVGSGTSVTLDGMSSTYDAYMVIGSDIQRSGSVAPLRMRVRIASSTKTDSNYTQGGVTGASSVDILDLSNVATHSSQFQLLITVPSNTSIYKPIKIEGIQGTDCTGSGASCRYEGSTGAINGLYFFPTSGPFQGGTFTLYGLRT